jgi:hypothetical protein
MSRLVKHDTVPPRITGRHRVGVSPLYPNQDGGLSFTISLSNGITPGMIHFSHV